MLTSNNNKKEIILDNWIVIQHTGIHPRSAKWGQLGCNTTMKLQCRLKLQ
jgi:hypothetical protein